MRHEHEGNWVIEGVDEVEGRFRPGDWVERLTTMMVGFTIDYHHDYGNEVQPCVIHGERSLVLSRALAQRHPQLYAYVMQFARDNRICIQEERRVWALPVGIERRAQSVR